MNQTLCGVCGGSDFVEARQVTSSVEPYRADTIVRCEACTHHQLTPKPSQAELDAFYSPAYPWYRVTDQPYTLRACLRRQVFKQVYGRPSLATPVAQAVFRWLIPNYPEFISGGKVLDVGCGAGTLLKELLSVGWACTGVDRNPSLRNGLESCGISFVDGDVVASLEAIPSGTFHAVIANHALEHFENPAKAIHEIKRVLRRNGQVIIVVPNIDSFVYRKTADKWPQIQCPGHLQFFTKHSLCRLLSDSGITVERWFYSQVDPSTIVWLGCNRLSALAARVMPGLVSVATQALNLLELGDAIVAVARKKDEVLR